MLIKYCGKTSWNQLKNLCLCYQLWVVIKNMSPDSMQFFWLNWISLNVAMIEKDCGQLSLSYQDKAFVFRVWRSIMRRISYWAGLLIKSLLNFHMILWGDGSRHNLFSTNKHKHKLFSWVAATGWWCFNVYIYIYIYIFIFMDDTHGEEDRGAGKVLSPATQRQACQRCALKLSIF